MAQKTRNSNDLAKTFKQLAETQMVVASHLTPEQVYREGWFTAQFLDELADHGSEESSERMGAIRKDG
jgi:uncharacterized protein YecA (UPF0149 family)